MNKNPNCRNCEHFYITVDERFPMACRVFGVKGKRLPSADVKMATGHICPVFQSKITKKKHFYSEESTINELI